MTSIYSPSAAGGWRTAARSRFRGTALFFFLFVVLAFLMGLPLVFLFYGALWSAPPGAEGGHFTVANYTELLGRQRLWRLLFNSLLLGISTAIVSVVIGTALAWIFVRAKIGGVLVWTNLLTIPLFLSPLMLSLAWIALAAPRVGLLNALWHSLGGEGDLLNAYSFACMVWILGSHYAPYIFLSLIGPLRAIDASLEEAAMIAGSSAWHVFRTITLPLMWPAMLGGGIIVTILAAENFAVPTLLGRPSNFRTIPSEIYMWLTYEPTAPGLAAGIGTILLTLSIAGTFIYRQVTRNASRFVTVGGKPKPVRRVDLGRYRPWVIAAMVLYFLFAVVLPVSALVLGSFLGFMSPRINFSSLTLLNYSEAFNRNNLPGLRNSLILAVGTATTLTVLGALIAYAASRGRFAVKGVLDYLSLTGVAIPGIVLGVGMLWAYVGAPFGVYGTIWILFLAYFASFIGHSVRANGSSLLPISKEFEEAAQILGSGMFDRLRKVLFPLMARGMIAAWILIFIFTINEVSSTIILYSPHTITLSVLAWQSMEMAGAMQAFAFATIQGMIVFVAIGLMTWSLRRSGGQIEQ